MPGADHDLTEALAQWSEEGPAGFDEALRRLYPEIRKAAAHLLRHSPLTLSPETLAQEVSIELASLTHSSWSSRKPFFAFIYMKMRQYLAQYREKIGALKRDPRQAHLVEVDPVHRGPGPELAERELHRLLSDVFHDNLYIYAVVVLKLAGFTNDEIARKLNLSSSTIDRRLDVARRRLKVVLRLKGVPYAGE